MRRVRLADRLERLHSLMTGNTRDARPELAGRPHERKITMTEPRTYEFNARWGDQPGTTTIEVGEVGNREVWVNVGGNTAEVLLSPREAVKLAHALLTVAAPAAGTVKQFVTGAGFMGSDPGPARTIWLLDAEPLT